MKDKILTICLGNNNGNLYGCVNDSIIFYNYILNLSNRLHEWLKPSILFNLDVNFNNIKEIISKETTVNKILLFYSGHGFNNGYLNIYSNTNSFCNNDTSLIKLIDESVENDIELYIILDSCYAGSFKIVPYKKVKKIKLIASSQKNQMSSESFTKMNNIYIEDCINNYKETITTRKNNVTIGVFTYNFVDLLLKKKIYKIDEFKNVFTDSIWHIIKETGNQEPVIIW